MVGLSSENRILIVGAGLTGSCAARQLAEVGRFAVDIVDKKSMVSGNVYDPVLPSGHRIHLHGPHAFHTVSKDIYDFLSRFTRWTKYEHRVLAVVDGKEVPVPCNFQTLLELSPQNGTRWVEHLSKKFSENEHIAVLAMRESPDQVDREVAQFAYEKLFEFYTRKQWGYAPEELSPSVTARVPIRMGFDDRYFMDEYQFIPQPGYYEMVCNVLDHKDINISLNTELSGDSFSAYEKVIFTGPIDKLCGYEFGPLPYRSLNFDFEFHDEQFVQSVAQLNFTQSEDWTRTTEFKHMTSQVINGTVVAKEFSIEHDPKINDPYYPIPREDERIFYRRYEDLVSQRFPNVVLAGRLADYRYYNMDRAVARGLFVADGIVNRGDN